MTATNTITRVPSPSTIQSATTPATPADDIDLGELLALLADPAIDIPEICGHFDIPPTKLAELLATPKVQAILEAIEYAVTTRERMIAAKARPEVLQSLLFNATRESASPETQRKSAALLAKLTEQPGATGGSPASAAKTHASTPRRLTPRSTDPHTPPAPHAPTAAPPPAGAAADTQARESNQTPGNPWAASRRSRIARLHRGAGTAHQQTAAPTHHRAPPPDAPCSTSPNTPHKEALPQPPPRHGGDRYTGAGTGPEMRVKIGDPGV